MAKFFLFDESMQSAKAKITTAKLATMGDIVANEKAFIYAEGEDAPDEITVMGNVLVAVGNSIFKTVETTLTAANLDSGSAFTVGTDYNIFVCDPTNGDETVDQNEVFVISASTTYPVGYTAANSRRIGGFHYGVVRKIDDNGEPVNASGTTRGSGWESNVYNAPDYNAQVIAKAEEEVVGLIKKCPSGKDFCLINFENKIEGWVSKNDLFGIYPNEVID